MVQFRSLLTRSVAVAAAPWPALTAFGLGVLLAGCASSGVGKHGEAPDEEAVPVSAGTGGSMAADNATATETATLVPGERSGDTEFTTGPVLKAGAPKEYTVKRGDTLWGIASLYLRDPWLWPEIWYVNPQVENPHLIYPGDVLALARGSNGRPEVRLIREGSARAGYARLTPRLRVSAADAPIATIPYEAIAAFLMHPGVLSKEQYLNAPHVAAFRDAHEGGGTGDEIYVPHLNAQKDTRFSVLHVEDRLKDPDSGDFLGYVGIYTASALVTRPGNPATALLSDSTRETLEGDKLVEIDTNVPLTFVPRAPRRKVHGTIIAVADGGDEVIGQYRVVVINRGARDGLEAGSVLGVNARGQTIRDTHDVHFSFTDPSSILGPKVHLPDERTGTMLVFKTYDRISYGLIVDADNMIHVLDRVENP